LAKAGLFQRSWSPLSMPTPRLNASVFAS